MADGYDALQQCQLDDDSKLVFAETSPLRTVMSTVRRVSPSNATVLITGETGTGKEVMAREVHRLWSKTQQKPGRFVPVNCGAIPENLIESELFGHAKGAFTGAHCAREGRVAMAEGGTLFLDEIGELPLNMQVKLLRLLQERTFEPVGSSKTQKATFRLVAATNRDLREEVAAGRFREDLYYRLFVCPVHLPALRERPGDVVPLVQHFWAELGETRAFTTETLRALEKHAWPGNVRELANLVERLSVCTVGHKVDKKDLPEGYGLAQRQSPVSAMSELRSNSFTELAPHDAAPPPSPNHGGFVFGAEANAANVELDIPEDLPNFLRELEWQFIERALNETKGNKQAAARMLGLGRTTLVEKIRRREARA